jgi:hypothetical protein
VGFLAIAGLAGCAQTFDATKLGVPATLSSDAGTPAEGPHFEVTSRAVWGMWGLFKLGKPNLEKALAHQLVGGQSIADIKIKSRARWSDILITGLTLGLVSTRSVTVEGTIVGTAAGN